MSDSKKPPRSIVETILWEDFDESKLLDLIERAARQNVPLSECVVTSHRGYDDSYMELTWRRPESDVEYEARCASIEMHALERERVRIAIRRQEYEKMKLEFDGPATTNMNGDDKT